MRAELKKEEVADKTKVYTSMDLYPSEFITAGLELEEEQ